MDLTFAAFAVLAFLAVVLSLEGLFNLWQSKHGAEAKRIRQRMAALSGESHREATLERAQERKDDWLSRILVGTGDGSRLDRWVSAAGTQTTATELVAWTAVLVVVGAVVPSFMKLPTSFSLALALALGAVPWLVVGQKRAARIRRFEHQLPEALDMMARALRAGHAFPSAIKMCGEETAEPLGRDLRIFSDELNYGMPMQQALQNFAGRVPVDDVRFFSVAVMIQRESGGNLAELLEKISGIIRERLKLHGQVRTLTAEGRFSAIVLVGLPLFMAFILNLINPKMTSMLWTDPAGQKMVGVALVMMILGVLWMRKLIRIRV
jgi:tight adherence protein B